MLNFADGRPFATGCLTYYYHPAIQEDSTPRINLQVNIRDQPSSAILDTGSPFVICDPQIADVLNLSPESGISSETIRFRDQRLRGNLFRLPVLLPAEQGENLSVEATIFVPELAPHQEWGDFPSVIGLNGFLERIRFAVDPSEDKFYFGPLG